jgi:hypothetical protein
MSDFVFLYRGGSMPEGEAAQAQVMDAWTGWFTQLGSTVKDGGNPFTPQGKSLSPDGSVSDIDGTLASGYSIIEADSFAAALDIAKGCPVLQGGASVEVYETFPVM